MPLRLCWVFCVIAVCLFCLPRAPQAADLRLGYPDQPVYPFHLGAGGEIPQPPGMAVDLTLRLLRQSGLSVELLRLPIRRLHEEVRAGRVDGWLGLSYTPERAEYLAYPLNGGQPDSARRLLASQYALYRPLGGSAHWAMQTGTIQAGLTPTGFIPHGLTPPGLTPPGLTPTGLTSGPLGMPAGFALVQDMRGQGLAVEEFGDAAHMFRLLALNRLGAVLAKENAADRMIEALGMAPRIEKLPGLMARDYFLAVNKRLYAERHDAIEALWDAMAQQRDAVYAELAPLYR